MAAENGFQGNPRPKILTKKVGLFYKGGNALRIKKRFPSMSEGVKSLQPYPEYFLLYTFP